MREGTLRERAEVGSSEAGGSGRPVPPPLEGADVLDWDASIDVPPPRRSGTVRVSLDRAGRSRPFPVEDPASD
jgi:hypothetical protein